MSFEPVLPAEKRKEVVAFAAKYGTAKASEQYGVKKNTIMTWRWRLKKRVQTKAVRIPQLKNPVATDWKFKISSKIQHKVLAALNFADQFDKENGSGGITAAAEKFKMKRQGLYDWRHRLKKKGVKISTSVSASVTGDSGPVINEQILQELKELSELQHQVKLKQQRIAQLVLKE
jgi:hypothetical protein